MMESKSPFAYSEVMLVTAVEEKGQSMVTIKTLPYVCALPHGQYPQDDVVIVYDITLFRLGRFVRGVFWKPASDDAPNCGWTGGMRLSSALFRFDWLGT